MDHAIKQPLLFLFSFFVRLAPYPWLTNPTNWLRVDFFMVRNVVALLVLAIVAVCFRRVSLTDRASVRQWAVAYILPLSRRWCGGLGDEF
jgi:hypothetical protein